jgi:hypothetical protein
LSVPDVSRSGRPRLGRCRRYGAQFGLVIRCGDRQPRTGRSSRRRRLRWRDMPGGVKSAHRDRLRGEETRPGGATAGDDRPHQLSGALQCLIVRCGRRRSSTKESVLAFGNARTTMSPEGASLSVTLQSDADGVDLVARPLSPVVTKAGVSAGLQDPDEDLDPAEHEQRSQVSVVVRW